MTIITIQQENYPGGILEALDAAAAAAEANPDATVNITEAGEIVASRLPHHQG